PKRMRAAVHKSMGWHLKQVSKVTEEQDEYCKGIAILETLLKDASFRPEYAAELAALHRNLCQSVRDSGDPAGAEKHVRKAIEIWAALVDKYNDLQERLAMRRNAADSHVLLGIVLHDLMRLPESEDEFRRAIALLTQVQEEASTVESYRRGVLPKYGSNPV